MAEAQYPILRLKPGKDGSLKFHHPWVFSGALQSPPDNLENGALVRVADSDGLILGTGTYSSKSMIAVRVFEFGSKQIDFEWLRSRITSANERRLMMGYGPKTNTTGYRVVFGESDGLPGLIIDRYEDVIAMQLATAGIERLKDELLKVIVELFQPAHVFERSDIAVRKEEELSESVKLLIGEDLCHREFLENDIRFLADVKSGQKTGFYLDQRLLRMAISEYSKSREVVNLFSNSGSFAVMAIKGGSKSILNVDSSQSALDLIGAQLSLNNCSPELMSSECVDVFQWLSSRHEPMCDMVILDPPALIKSQHDYDSGAKAYHFLNRAAIRLVRDGGILVTSSCSSHFSEKDFVFMLRRASIQAGARLEVLKAVGQPPDHPVSIYFPESAYLKSLICLVQR